MTGPRDPVPQFGVPVNIDTGLPVSERQTHHLDAIATAGEGLLNAMHAAEGSSPRAQYEEHFFTSRRMNIAATQIETALMFARKAALETP